jgi:protein-disulfide isomerase
MPIRNHMRSSISLIADLASIASALAIVSVAGAIAWSFASGGRTIAANVNTPRVPPVSTVTGLETRDNGTTVGADRSDIVLVEFSDYECPYCGRFAREIYPRLREKYIDKGRVAYTFRNFPIERIHARAFRASEAALCAHDQQKFWEMHDRLFVDQQRLSESDLLVYAESIGLDVKGFSSCLREGRAKSVEADLAEGQRLGVRGTPTFFVGRRQADGRIVLTQRIAGSVSYEAFERVLDHLLAASESS